jgi:hypothetical protein
MGFAFWHQDSVEWAGVHAWNAILSEQEIVEVCKQPFFGEI